MIKLIYIAAIIFYTSAVIGSMGLVGCTMYKKQIEIYEIKQDAKQVLEFPNLK
jgi:hypothetical protein